MLIKLNEEFTFDWNDYRTIESNKKKIDEIEVAIEKAASSIGTLDEKERQALGQLCYKLGTFYNHIKRTPVPAFEKLLIAEKILTNNELAWVKNHIAFSYQQILAAAKREKNVEKIEENKTQALEYCNQVIKQYESLEKSDVEFIKIAAFAYCVRALVEYEADQLDIAVNSYRFALDLYEKHGLLDDQYARAKNRYAQFLVEQQNDVEANKAFEELEKYWSEKQDNLNPYPARFYVSYAHYLTKMQLEDLALILEKYKKAYDILHAIEGEQSLFTKDVYKKISEIQEKLSLGAFDATLVSMAKQLMRLPFEARDIFIESLSTMLVRGFVPMSGMTIQQHISARPEYLEQLNTLTKKKDAYKNDTSACFAYLFPRQATSAGIIPAYRDNKTGDIYFGLICNTRNQKIYNWSAGYTEAPLPGWRGKLLSDEKQEIYYNRANIKDSATRTMVKVLEEADGDWTKVDYDHARFEKEFKTDGVILPKIDINSLHTASRECIEEINLDLNQFPERKTFLISHDDTVGISQGDAPGQTSNRSHQYLVFLGDFEAPPEIKPGDDVAIADWVNVSKIVCNSPTEYFANGKPLCVYMLRGIELGLKDLWNHLLEQASTRISRYSGKALARFSTPENILAEIEGFCDKHDLKITGTNIALFMQYLSGDLPSKTYTGKFAQQLLNCMLQTAAYLLSSQLEPENFFANMTKILSPLEVPLKVYSQSATVCHFRPAPTVDSRAQANQPGVKIEDQNQSTVILDFTGMK
ncbi:MAG TPA: hypothetical protein VJN02_05825 [Gammaproteobacteria bacterium]|nr:hypothetical protein [Gammaproteobacteria bacterium]